MIIIPAYGLIKLSVLFFYRRIFVKGTNSRFDKVTKFSVAVVILWTIAFVFAQVFKCGASIPNNWGPLIDAVHCADPDKISDGLFVSDFITDFLVLILPIPIVGNNLMGMMQHLTLIAISIDCEAKHVHNAEAQRHRCANAWDYVSTASRVDVIKNRHLPGLFVHPLSGWYSASKLPRLVWPKRQTSMVGLRSILIHTVRLDSNVLLLQKVSQQSCTGACLKLAFL